MTPLAQSLSKLLVSKRNKPDDIFWNANIRNLRRSLFDTHFFEATDVIPLMEELSKLEKTNRSGLEETFALFGFLPAPKTWIEWSPKYAGERIAVLLEERGDNHVDATMFSKLVAQPLGVLKPKTCDIQTPGGTFVYPERITRNAKEMGIDGGELALAFMQTAHYILVMINSPKIIGRRQHMPHSGLERRLKGAFGAGKFPLHAWTELKLNVTKPIDIDDGEPHEAHLTGRRALHFCRKHIRIRFGRLEYVSAHWRGDPSIGIKQTRYKVVI